MTLGFAFFYLSFLSTEETTSSCFLLVVISITSSMRLPTKARERVSAAPFAPAWNGLPTPEVARDCATILD